MAGPGQHVFEPEPPRFETGKLYRLVLRKSAPTRITLRRTDSRRPHLHPQGAGDAGGADGREVTLAEFKGAIREIEVYPGQAAEWWFVPVATGRVTDLRCGIVAAGGQTHADARHGR